MACLRRRRRTRVIHAHLDAGMFTTARAALLAVDGLPDGGDITRTVVRDWTYAPHTSLLLNVDQQRSQLRLGPGDAKHLANDISRVADRAQMSALAHATLNRLRALLDQAVTEDCPLVVDLDSG